MKKTKFILSALFLSAIAVSSCNGGNSSSKVPSSPTPSIPTPSVSSPKPSTPSSPATPSASTPAPSTPNASTPKPSTPSVSTPAPSVSVPDTPTPDPIVPDAPVEGNLFVATGWEEGEELTADVNEGSNIVFWADDNWVGAKVTATTSVEDGIFTIDPTHVSGDCWHGLQAFINVPNNAAGDKYDISFTIYSSVAGQITVNDQVIDLVVGENDITAKVTILSENRWDGAEFVTSPISIQFGTMANTGEANAAMQDAEYKLYNIVILKDSSTPEPGPEIPTPEVPTEGNLFVATGWEEADEYQADMNEGANIVYWADQNWSNSMITATTSVENGVFTIDPTYVSGDNWFGLQTFINVPGNAAGDIYDVSLTLNSSVAGQITFNGQVIDIAVGDNELSTQVTLTNATTWDGKAFISAPVYIQYGVNGNSAEANHAMQDALYQLSNIVIEKHSGTQTPDPENPNPEVPGDLSFNLTDTKFGEEANMFNDNYVGHTIAYWNDQNWVASNVVVNASVTEGVATYEVATTPWNAEAYVWYGFQAFAVPTGYAAGATYKVSFNLNSTVAGQINVAGTPTNIVVGDNPIEYIVTPAANKAPFSVIFGIEGDNANNAIVQNATYQISNLVFENHVEETPENPNPEDPNPENPTPTPDGDETLKQYFTVNAMATGGAANNIQISWTDAAHKVTKAPTVEDFSVNVGLVANLDFATLGDSNVHFNVITGADTERNVSVILHTDNGDYIVTIVIKGGAYDSYYVESTECYHSTEEPEDPTVDPTPDTPVELPAKPEGASDFVLGGAWNPHGDGFLLFSIGNSEFTTATIAEYNIYAIIDGEEVAFDFNRIDGAYNIVVRNTTLGLGIGTSNYVFVVELTMTDGTVYFGAFNVVNGRVA